MPTGMWELPGIPLIPWQRSCIPESSCQLGCKAGFLGAVSKDKPVLLATLWNGTVPPVGAVETAEGLHTKFQVLVAAFEVPRVCALQGQPRALSGEAVAPNP